MPRETVKYEYVLRKVEDLIPYARNARVHSEAQVAQLAGAMREFGFTNPVLIDEEATIIAGHGRIMAAKKLKMAEVPCLIVAGLTDAQRRALIVADNKLALNATWDNDMLVQELGDISEDGFDLDIIGFSAGEMDSLLGLGSGDLMDPTDGEGDTRGEAQNLLCWGEMKVPLTEDEIADLNAAFSTHSHKNGVAYGFARALLNGQFRA